MSGGFTILEMLVVVALITIGAGMSIPLVLNGLDASRTGAAARYLSNRLMLARFEAIKRSRFVAVQFVEKPDGYWFRTYVDGNANGVLARDIARGADLAITAPERLDQNFPGTMFGIFSNVTAIVPGDPFSPADPIQIGQSTLLSFNPNGSSTGGSVYIRGAHSQFAVRVLGVTARSRIFRFDFGDGKWQTP